MTTTGALLPNEPPKSSGRIAYEGYFAKCEGKSLISGAPLPSWNEQSNEIRLAWQAAADAVLSSVENFL